MNSRYVYWAIVVITIMVLWLLTEYPFIGQIFISLYALYAFWRSVPSEQAFRLALVAMGVTCIATLLQNFLASNSFAGYAFSLFMFGILLLGKELWQLSVALRKQKEEEESA